MNNLTLKDVFLSREEEKLEDISFELAEGDSLAIVGETVSCRSLLVETVAGIREADSGTLTMFDVAISEATKQALGYVFNGFPLSGSLTLEDVDRVFSSIYERWNSSMFYGCCHKFAIQKKKPIKELSPIMQRKLMLSIAVSHATRLLVLNDVFSSIDGGIDDEAEDVLKEFMKKNPLRSMVIAAPDISSVNDLVKRYILLKDGGIALSFSKDELLNNLCLVECSMNDKAVTEAARYLFKKKDSNYVTALIDSNAVDGGYTKSSANLADIDKLFGGIR